MSAAIRFLETVGSNALSAANYEGAVAGLEVDELHRKALLQRNPAALNDILGGRPTMFFGVLAPEEQPLEDEPFEDIPDELPDESAN
ncbi:hypothetical protein [Cognatiluteimonas profundi]|uniref:hypothetical protein n=1 Tax=Cognatiluteimonas profundi TaxID=2594501 RepID=UPI00131E0F14|nr:hypothetical protein [Lysobacter profundi]